MAEKLETRTPSRFIISWLGNNISVGESKLCHKIAEALVASTKLPVSSMAA